MARIETDPNYSSPTFSRATAGTDLFKKEDVQLLASALSTHDHSSTKGLAVIRLGTLSQDVTFSNADAKLIAPPVLTIQSSTTNGQSGLDVLPNGTSTIAGLSVYGGSTKTNMTYGTLSQQGTNTLVIAGRTGSGAYGNLLFQTSGLTRGTLDTAGVMTFNGDVVASTKITIGAGGSNYSLAFNDTNHRITSGVQNFTEFFEEGSEWRWTRTTTLARIATLTPTTFTVAGGVSTGASISSGGGVTVDNSGVNNGTWDSTKALQLGTGGEGMASQRVAGGPFQFGVAIFTASAVRFIVSNAGPCTVGNGSGSYNAINASAFTVNSTRRNKRDLAVLDQASALDQVLDDRLVPYAFTRNDTNDRHLGFVAEDMAEVIPEATSLDTRGELEGINYGALVPVLWSAVRELSSRLAALEN